jgi:hypothetical protein
MWAGVQCPKCDDVKKVLLSNGFTIDERPAAGLTNGDEFNPAALKHLAAQNYATPLVFVDDCPFDMSSLTLK